MVVAPVDEGYVDCHIRQSHACAQAGETAADHHHPGTGGKIFHRRGKVLSHSDTLHYSSR
jgi:hypothetical protein